MRRVLAWLGGALFLAALASTAFLFLIGLADPGPTAAADARAAVLIDVGLFSAFALHHSLLARTRVKCWLSRGIAAESERTLYVWMASLLLLAVCWGWRDVPGTFYVIEAPWRWALVVVQLAGVWLTVKGAAVIDPLELAGIRQATGDHRPVAFRVVGPFRLVRHPIYLGWLLMVFGTPVMTGNRLLFAVISSAYLVVAIPFEERSLIGTFGDTYRAYRRQVPWRLVPFVW